MSALLLIAVVASAAQSSTADLAFMIGEWRLEGAFNPGAANERTEAGSQRCAFVFDRAYVRCDRKLTARDGKSREQVTYHNYNRLYARYEHLFISSNWPTKVIGHSGLERKADDAEMIVDIAFALPDGKTEQVRSVDRFGADRLESVEQLRVGDGEWRTNYRLTGTRVAR